MCNEPLFKGWTFQLFRLLGYFASLVSIFHYLVRMRKETLAKWENGGLPSSKERQWYALTRQSLLVDCSFVPSDVYCFQFQALGCTSKWWKSVNCPCCPSEWCESGLVGLVWSSSGFWLLSSLIRTMDVADPEDMTWRLQLLSTHYKRIKLWSETLTRMIQSEWVT